MLVEKISSHVADSLGRMLYQYRQLPAQYLLRLNGTPAYVPPGTYTPILTLAPAATLPFGYGSLVGVAQAFQLTSADNIGQVTFHFQATGTVSDGLVTAYLYADDGTSPSQYAVPKGTAIMRSVEAYSAREIAEEWVSTGSAGYLAKTFTFDFDFPPGYYWVVLRSTFPGNPGNSLLLGLDTSGGLAFANGYRAGQDVTGFFGPNGASGSKRVALTLAEKTSAPPLEPGNVIETSGIGVLVATLADQAQVLENALYDLDQDRQLFDGATYPATGKQLDGLGELVNQPRNGFVDALYLVFILGKIGENYSTATIPEITTLISLLFQTPTFKVFQFFPAQMNIEIPETAGLDPQYFAEATRVISRSLGGGIAIGFGASYPSNPFLCRDLNGPSVGGGFGDVNDVNAGGGMASVFYNNAGA